MSNINEIPQGSWWYSYTNLNRKNFDFLRKFCDLDPKVTPGVGMVLIKTLNLYLPSCQIWMKSFKGVFKIWGLINFNAKTLTLWRKDERTNEWWWFCALHPFQHYLSYWDNGRLIMKGSGQWCNVHKLNSTFSRIWISDLMIQRWQC